MPLTTKKKVTPIAEEATERVTENEKEKAKVEGSIEVETPVNEENIGSKSDTLIFIAPLGDPSRKDVTVQKDGSKKTDPTIFGYRFKCTEDIEVPDVMPADLKVSPMSYSGDTLKTRLVKAGTEFDLTKFETGMLISREEYNGRATGGDKPVSCAYTVVQKKGTAGALATTGSAAKLPSIALRAITGSIKDYEMIPILSYTTEVTSKNVKRINRTINPGFEKFASLAEEATRKSSGSAGSNSTANKNERSKGAAAFLQIAGAKKA